MWDFTEEISHTSVSVCTPHDFAALQPYVGMLYGVAMRYTQDACEAQSLLEQALVTAAMRNQGASAHGPKMALLSALREAYIESREFSRV